MVRGKVGSLKARQSEVPPAQRPAAADAARNYFAAAYRYAKAGSPALIVVCGLPSSGKSTIAQALADRSGFAVFNSDVIRKRRAGIAPTARAGAGWNQGIYSREFTDATYQALAEAAAQALRSGDGVIIDATYRDTAERMRLRAIAREAAAPIVFVECAVTDEQAKQRLFARARHSDAVSDATWETYVEHKASFAPFAVEFAGCHLRVDGAAPPAKTACEIEQFITNYC
jgi:predicted kinase